jgi:lipopolysaccharide assembly protein A
MVLKKVVSLIRWCLAIFVCILFTVFAVNNRDIMTIDLFPFPFIAELPKFLYSIFFLLCGLLLGWYSCSKKIWHLSSVHRKDELKIAALENEIAGYAAEQTPTASPASTLLPKS